MIRALLLLVALCTAALAFWALSDEAPQEQVWVGRYTFDAKRTVDLETERASRLLGRDSPADVQRVRQAYADALEAPDFEMELVLAADQTCTSEGWRGGTSFFRLTGTWESDGNTLWVTWHDRTGFAFAGSELGTIVRYSRQGHCLVPEARQAPSSAKERPIAQSRAVMCRAGDD